MSGAPEVSVVIPAYYSDATIASCLEALERQTFRDFEVIVVDSTPNDRTPTILRDRFPAVSLIRSAERLLPHAARNRGAAAARGRILAFTDPDCRAHSDWLELLVAAHREGHEAVGGAIEAQERGMAAAVHVVKFAWWLPGGRPGPHRDLPTANASYARVLWDDVGPFLETRFAGDTEMGWRIMASGRTLWYEPRAIVTHTREPGGRALYRERYLRGRDFGLTRVDRQRWSRARCLVYLAAAPLLPFVMTARAARYALGCGHALTWLITSPTQLVANGAWCVGEARSHWEAVWRS